MTHVMLYRNHGNVTCHCRRSATTENATGAYRRGMPHTTNVQERPRARRGLKRDTIAGRRRLAAAAASAGTRERVSTRLPPSTHPQPFSFELFQSSALRVTKKSRTSHAPRDKRPGGEEKRRDLCVRGAVRRVTRRTSIVSLYSARYAQRQTTKAFRT